jgi:hypothetical protein
MGNGLTAGNSQPVITHTQHSDSPDSAIGPQRSKAEATLIATLALAGHAVHELRNGDYLVCKYGYSYYAQDLDALRTFAVRLGVCNA